MLSQSLKRCLKGTRVDVPGDAPKQNLKFANAAKLPTAWLFADWQAARSHLLIVC